MVNYLTGSGGLIEGIGRNRGTLQSKSPMGLEGKEGAEQLFSRSARKDLGRPASIPISNDCIYTQYIAIISTVPMWALVSG